MRPPTAASATNDLPACPWCQQSIDTTGSSCSISGAGSSTGSSTGLGNAADTAGGSTPPAPPDSSSSDSLSQGARIAISVVCVGGATAIASVALLAMRLQRTSSNRSVEAKVSEA